MREINEKNIKKMQKKINIPKCRLFVVSLSRFESDTSFHNVRWLELSAVMLLSIFLISLVIKNAQSFECNATTEFRCSNKCIPLEWRCDNIPDCSDNTDEEGCNYVHQCRVGMMMCRDGTCIAQSFKCDGEADCIDGHDEHSCENVDLSHLRNRDEAPQYYNTAAECTSPKKLCKTGGQCLSETAVCDGIKDCPDGDDEEGCLKPLDPTTNLLSKPSDQPCSYGHKKCASDDVCIPSYWICDGSEDCSDGSDELNCDGGDGDEERDVQSNNALCKRDEYRCEGESGKCIPREFQCNGTPDCPHADDESEKKCHDCLSRHCAHKCRLTDFGGECYCPHGSKLNDDGETCAPINFCETDDAKMCQHFCSSHESGYKCSCAAQYVLGDDSHSCHVEKKSEGHILLALGSTVRSMPLSDPAHSNDGYTQLKAEGSHGAVRMIDYNQHDKAIYMSLTQSLRSSEGELAAIVNDTEKILRQNIVGIENIAFDYVGKNIYYTQKYPAKKPGIYVCTVDGLFCKRIVTGNPAVEGDTAKRQSYRGLALNPLSGKMVWIDHYNHKHKIMIANMDGSDAKMLLDNKLEEPQGIAFDPIKDEVYYADFSTTSIEKINLKTKERSVVVSRGVHHPFDLKYFDGYLYWSDWGTESLKSVEISKVHSSAQTLHSFRQFPMGLAIKHPNYQVMPSVNPCEHMDKTCRWMCVPISGYQSGELKAQCVCPDGYKYEEGTCIPEKAFALDDGDSYIGTIYMEELCAQGTACQNGGECRKSASHGLQRIYCSCPASFTGERCEISDPHAKPLVKDDDAGSSSWTVFWFLFCIFTLMVAAFAFLYHKSRTVNQFTRTTLAHLESPDLSGLRPIVNNVKTKLQSLPSRVSASTGRFTHTHVEESSEAESAFVQPTVTFNNPMYLENPPTRRTSSSESSITWSDPTTLK